MNLIFAVLFPFLAVFLFRIRTKKIKSLSLVKQSSSFLIWSLAVEVKEEPKVLLFKNPKMEKVGGLVNCSSSEKTWYALTLSTR